MNKLITRIITSFVGGSRGISHFCGELAQNQQAVMRTLDKEGRELKQMHEDIKQELSHSTYSAQNAPLKQRLDYCLKFVLQNDEKKRKMGEIYKVLLDKKRRIESTGAKWDPAKWMIIVASWVPPELGWVKVNTDGGYRANANRASAGGLIRSYRGECLVISTVNIGSPPINDESFNIVNAELLGLYHGLHIAKHKGFRRVVAEIDSMDALKMVLANKQCGQHSAVVTLIKDLLRSAWSVRLQHTYREGNFAADHLVSLGYGAEIGVKEYPTLPGKLDWWLTYDTVAVGFPRLVRQ